MFFRSWILMGGPIGLIGLCYAIAGPTGTEPLRSTARLAPIPVDSPLEEACGHLMHEYAGLLPDGWNVISRPPFVLASDLTVDELRRLDAEIIIPTARALQIDYFDVVPSVPITVVLASSEAEFEECATRFGHRGHAEYAGLYSRDDRRLLLNLATGEGTIAHELTHALAHLDFPEMPEWFDEGLASLHEDSEFSADGLTLIGRANWRTQLLHQEAIQGRLPALEEFVQTPFNGPHAAQHYAIARGLCLYLQERGRLGAFYRKCRSNFAVDPTGGWSLAAVLGQTDLQKVDTDFQHWAQRVVIPAASDRAN